MKTRPFICCLILALALAGASLGSAQQPSQPSQGAAPVTAEDLVREATAAYQRSEYAKSVRLFQEAIAKGARGMGVFYDAACSAALAGDKETAFQLLDKALSAGWRNTEHLKSDSDLKSLHEDPRWAKAVTTSEAQQTKYIKEHSDPNRVQFVTEDIGRFWLAYDKAMAAKPEERAAIFQQDYIAPGTIGLKDFGNSGRLDSKRLAATIERRANFYRAIRALTSDLQKQRADTIVAFRKLKELYPEVVFPDAYFVIGQMQSGGTASANGLLMGAEMFTRAPGTPMDELNDWAKKGLMEPNEIPPLVTHEAVHFQQRYPLQGGLLCHCLKEGSADFLGELASGRLIVRMQNTHVWANARERELWDEFQKDVTIPANAGRWFTGGSADRPVDLGYWMGYKISEAHYKNATDKKQAIRDLLLVKDCQQLLHASRYAEKFSGAAPTPK